MWNFSEISHNHNHISFLIGFLLFYNSNREILFGHSLLNSTNVTESVYEQVLNATFNHNKTEAMAWGLSQECSLAHQLSQAAEGTGLAFIVFTQAIVSLPGAPFWSVLFFTMLLSLGLGSQIGLLEGMLCTLFDIDIFKRLRKPYVTGTLGWSIYFSVTFISKLSIAIAIAMLLIDFCALLWQLRFVCFASLSV